MTREDQLIALAGLVINNPELGNTCLKFEVVAPGESESWVWLDGEITGDPLKDRNALFQLERLCLDDAQWLEYMLLILDHLNKADCSKWIAVMEVKQAPLDVCCKALLQARGRWRP